MRLGIHDLGNDFSGFLDTLAISSSSLLSFHIGAASTSQGSLLAYLNRDLGLRGWWVGLGVCVAPSQHPPGPKLVQTLNPKTYFHD
jgi:hypothetical protein